MPGCKRHEAVHGGSSLKPASSRNVAASVRQRLLNIANSGNEDFGLVLTRYTLERLLYRLSRSDYRDQFILKGAMLFQVWTQAPHRPTRDLDLLGRGDPSPEHCREVFCEICRIPVEEDGLIFSEETVKTEKIKEERDYEGVRVKFLARLDNARIPIQVDVGFGDTVTPGDSGVARLSDSATLAGAPNSGLPHEYGCGRETGGYRQPRHAQQPNERFLRHLVPCTDIRV